MTPNWLHEPPQQPATTEAADLAIQEQTPVNSMRTQQKVNVL